MLQLRASTSISLRRKSNPQPRKDSSLNRRGLSRPEEDHRGPETRTQPSRRDVTGYCVLTAHLML